MRAPAARPQDAELRRTAWRIGLQTAALLLACLVVVGAVLYGAVASSQQSQLDQSLSNATKSAGYGRDDRDGDNPRGLDQPRGGVQVAVQHETGKVDPNAMPTGLPLTDVMARVRATGTQDQRTVRLPSGMYEVLTVQRGDDAVQAAANLFEQHQERERILGGLAIAGGAGLVLATLAGAVLARRAVRPMAEALEQQRRFVADAGHELRTPLTLLSTRAQLLARRLRDPRASAEERADRTEQDAAALVADAGALVSILEDLLTAADARTPVPQEPVDLVDVARAATRSARPAAQEAGLALDLVAPDGPVVVQGAPTALTRAVTALVDNAVDHARTRVEVTVARSGREVVVEVADDGPGIAQETLPRMFDRFASERRDDAGTGRRHFGLGLALVSEIAGRHGGRVAATNRPGPTTGAVLRLTLPVEVQRRSIRPFRRAAASGPAPAPDPLEPAQTPGGRRA